MSPVLHSLSDLLSSPRPDDAISEQLAEILGFEELDLAMEVLNDRQTVARDVCQLFELATEVVLSTSDDIPREASRVSPAGLLRLRSCD